MRQRYYECHITMKGNAFELRPIVEAMGWIFSVIDGDPDLGDGVKCYATKHFNERHGELPVVKALNSCANFLEDKNIQVLRRKVELVVYDVRAA